MPLQVRGSIPFLWEQIVDLTYKPKFEIVRPEEALSVFIYCQYFIVHLIHSTFTDFAGIRLFMQPRVAERHFLDLRKKYGSVLAVDLVNTVSIG